MNNLFEKGKSVLAILAVIFCCVGNVGAGTFEGTFTKITSTDDLTVGYYIIAASDSASNSNYVMGSTITNGQVVGVYKSLTDSTSIVNPDSSIVYYIGKKNISYYTFKCIQNGQYLYQRVVTSGSGLGWRDDGRNIQCDGYNDQGSAGFKFSFNNTGLSDNKNYILKYHDGLKVFANYSGNYSKSMAPFRLFKLEEGSQVPTGVEETKSGERGVKMIRDGQVLIVRDEKIYNAQGQRAE